jgi:hypothetical protein
MPLETGCVFEDAKSSFVNGQFVASIVLAASFVEHWLTSGLARRGFEKEAERGFAASIRFARKMKLVDPFLLDKADRLRLIRNPFAHLKLVSNEDTIGQRSAELRQAPHTVLENDAKEAMIAMYGVALYAFGSS